MVVLSLLISLVDFVSCSISSRGIFSALNPAAHKYNEPGPLHLDELVLILIARYLTPPNSFASFNYYMHRARLTVSVLTTLPSSI